MRLRDIMSEAVDIIGTEATVDEARQLMRRQDIRHLVAVERGAPVGVLSVHDLRRAERTQSVRSVMSAPVVTATPEATIRHAANLMRGNHVSCLPLLDEHDRIIGIVTVSDLLDLIGKGVTREPEVANRGRRSYSPGR
ncbi:MAG: CBS domain-containing protein [Myxococcales bacterium]